MDRSLFRALSAQTGAKGVVLTAKQNPEKPTENLELSSREYAGGIPRDGNERGGGYGGNNRGILRSDAGHFVEPGSRWEHDESQCDRGSALRGAQWHAITSLKPTFRMS